ncbi:MAG TPA: TlpA disulfide reductase family protein [Terriglobia bacterium]|nr:TlpA disulfide reductase family protein [Terriglobia bacterium]
MTQILRQIYDRLHISRVFLVAGATLAGAICFPAFALQLQSSPAANASQTAKTAQGTPSDQSVTPDQKRPARTAEEEEASALDQAVNSAERNPQALIKNLEHFLDRYPKSPRREQVLRTIYQQALQANDPRTAEKYAEALLGIHPEDPNLLSSLIDLLDRENDAASVARAIVYATRLVDQTEKLAAGARPAEIPEDRWQETTGLIRATGYSMRGKVYAKSGQNDKAFADYEKSYSNYPTSQVAEKLGDLAALKGDSDLALDFFVTAFAFPDKAVDPARREALRRKVGSAYIAKNKSENGLGDLILARYDQLNRSLKSRFQDSGRPNAGLNDPLQFVLQRLDGSQVRLADFRGKVLVMDFWATWCGPCRMEGRALERVIQTFSNQPAAAFLAVNVDDERTGVPGFVKEEQWKIPVAYAQGLDHFLDVTSLPTLLILDRQGQVVFREQGMNPMTFEQELEEKLREELARPPANASSR